MWRRRSSLTETELIIDGVVICEKGKVLNLNAVKATRIFDGKPLLAKGMARSIEDILQQEGLNGEVLRVQPSALEAFAQWVQLGQRFSSPSAWREPTPR